ncbi:MAG: biopolymer transporter ExbD [Sutterellaceae bacterium]|nr:biopolymer transporter ExbD [Burkholderiaceae bacterium]MCX7901157.1 biopolymer transporter ExbD [Burkholderiaceae bacterium]MDW8428951.1 biopolymer transporter ExbD [Sutterellaceae bacterium]
MRVRRLRRHPAGLDVTPFINLIVVLVPFLLSTAVFSRLAVLELSLPAQSGSFENLNGGDLKLEVVIRPDRLEVNDLIGGRLVDPIPHTANGPDTKRLNALMLELKKRFPDKTEATLLAEPNTPYEQLVRVMDAMRTAKTANGAQIVRTELFPQISIGDAPLSTVRRGT